MTIYHPAPETSLERYQIKELLTKEAYYQMTLGQIPALWNECLELHNSFFERNAMHNALQFVPTLSAMPAIDDSSLAKFLKNPDTTHVLVENHLIKVVLIHWAAGQKSGIHGHPAGGCVFKVLHGSLKELRYSLQSNGRELSSIHTYRKGAISYIDDTLALHAVSNSSGQSAVSLHVYTAGNAIH